MHWDVKKDGSMKTTKVDKNSIGNSISTKAPGLDEREDLTGKYKYPEGKSVFLHVFLIVHVCVCPFVRPFVIQSVIQSFSQWSCGQSVSLSFSQPVCLSVGPPPSQSDSLSVCQFVSLSVSQSVSQSGREAGGKASRQANRWAVDFSMALIKLARPTILIPSFLCLL